MAPIPIELALYQPDIAQNTGTLLRMGACLGVQVHIIHPAGFVVSDRNLKRSALDYLPHAAFTEHDSWTHFLAWSAAEARRVVLLTTHASQPHHMARYQPDDILLLGRESAGVPDAVAAAAGLRVRIPMRPGMRSLNVAVAGALVLGEALRQLGQYDALT